MREIGFAPNGIIDVGAHVGDWTRAIGDVFSAVPVLMVEARDEQELSLRRVCAELPDVGYAIALLGSVEQGAMQFQVNDTGSPLYAERSDASKTPRMLPMRRLDDVAAKFDRLRTPLFLKFDIQGGNCLRGAPRTLAKAEVVQLEVALLNYNEGAPLAAEVIAFMDAQGFSIFNIVGFVRPDGVNLVQIDVIFVAETSKLRPDRFRLKRGSGLISG